MVAPEEAYLQSGKLAPDLSAALVGLIADMPTALKDASNPHFKSKYATLDSIWSAVRPVLAKHDFALIQRTEPAGEGVMLETLLIHSSGNFISGRLFMPVAAAQKGNPHATGAALTYARRYGMSAMLSIITDEDDDANGAKPQHSVPAPATATTRKAMTGAIPAPPPAESQLWHGTITDISEKSGKSSSGKPWTLWMITGMDGTKFGTFDRKHRDTASFLSDAVVRIVWTTSAKGGKNIFSIESAEGDDATAIPPEEGDSTEVPF